MPARQERGSETVNASYLGDEIVALGYCSRPETKVEQGKRKILYHYVKSRSAVAPVQQLRKASVMTFLQYLAERLTVDSFLNQLGPD